jgi:CRP/FNR family transcriptional regulator, cyclic AMP receptor protein
MKLLKKQIDFPTLIRKLSPFSNLSIEAQKDLEQRFRYRMYSPNTVIMGLNKNEDELFLIRNGKTHITLKGNSNNDILLHSLSSGDIFGNPFPMKSSFVPTEIRSVNETSVLVLTRKSLNFHLRKFPETSLILLRVMAERLEETYESMACLSLGDVSSRLKRLLLNLAKKEGRKTEEGIIVPSKHTQRELAKMVGARRETVSRLISQFTTEGLLKRKGRILILPLKN